MQPLKTYFKSWKRHNVTSRTRSDVNIKRKFSARERKSSGPFRLLSPETALAADFANAKTFCLKDVQTLGLISHVLFFYWPIYQPAGSTLASSCGSDAAKLYNDPCKETQTWQATRECWIQCKTKNKFSLLRKIKQRIITLLVKK